MPKEPKIKRSREDLIATCKTQMRFLLTDCAAFDQGDLEQASNIAGRLRKFLHDTHQSTSCVAHLSEINSKRKYRLFFQDSSEKYNPKCRNGMWTLTSTYFHSQKTPIQAIKNSLTGFKMFPHCLNPAKIARGTYKPTRFPDWWQQKIIYGRTQNLYFSRKDIILYLSNEESGAHVDKELSERFHLLFKEEKLGKTGSQTLLFNGKESPRELVHMSVRQIADETIRSLKFYFEQLIF